MSGGDAHTHTPTPPTYSLPTQELYYATRGNGTQADTSVFLQPSSIPVDYVVMETGILRLTLWPWCMILWKT